MVTPDYASGHPWEVYSKQIALDYQQSFEEGLDVEKYRGVFLAVQDMPDGEEKEKIADVLFGIVASAPVREGYEYNEPSDPDGIRALRKAYEFTRRTPSREELADRIRGAWLGRVAGCLLGKTVEGMRTDELVPMLCETGNYPMTRYIRRSEITEEMLGKYKFNLRWRCYADTVPYAPADDDTNYTVLAQKLVNGYGRDFTPENVAFEWQASQPKYAYCTAERVTIRNLCLAFKPPMTALYKNPYREWIGAQIRADYYGYINPGDAQTAADMAWRDASISHIKNGIYGEMFVAAALASAAVTDSVKDAIYGGLAEIPQTSRFYKYITDVIAKYDAGESAEDVFAFIHETYDEHTDHGWCHTIPNAMIVVASLLFGGGDYGKSVCLAVQTGFDTDCNGATVGSIFGMLHGAGAIPSEWTEPLKDRLETSITGMATVTFDDLVKKTLEHIPEKN